MRSAIPNLLRPPVAFSRGARRECSDVAQAINLAGCFVDHSVRFSLGARACRNYRAARLYATIHVSSAGEINRHLDLDCCLKNLVV
jgi:hypothetical protein